MNVGFLYIKLIKMVKERENELRYLEGKALHQIHHSSCIKKIPVTRHKGAHEFDILSDLKSLSDEAHQLAEKKLPEDPVLAEWFAAVRKTMESIRDCKSVNDVQYPPGILIFISTKDKVENVSTLAARTTPVREKMNPFVLMHRLNIQEVNAPSSEKSLLNNIKTPHAMLTPILNRTFDKINMTVTLDSGSVKPSNQSNTVSSCNDSGIMIRSGSRKNKENECPCPNSHAMATRFSVTKNKSSKKKKIVSCNISSATLSKTAHLRRPLQDLNVSVMSSENKNKLSSIIKPLVQQKHSVVTKEQQILEEIKKKEKKREENIQRIMTERQLKAEQNKKTREEKRTKTLQKRMQLEKEKEEKRETKSKKSQVKVNRVRVGQVRSQQVVNVNKENPKKTTRLVITSHSASSMHKRKGTLRGQGLKCKNGCGYCGNPEWQGYCSKCHRELNQTIPVRADTKGSSKKARELVEQDVKESKSSQPNDSWNWSTENSFQQQPQQSSYLQEQQPSYIQEQQTNYQEQQLSYQQQQLSSYQQQLQHSYHEHEQSNFQHLHEQPNYLQQQNQQSLGLPADAWQQSPQTQIENQNFVQPSVNYDSSSQSIQPVNNNCNTISLDSFLQSTEADSLNTTQPAQLPWTYSAPQYFNQTPNLSTEFPSSCTSSNELWHLNSLIASKAEISIQSEFDCKSNDNVQTGAVNLESNISENYNIDESTENVASNCVPNCENVITNKDVVFDADYGNSSLSAFFQNSEQDNSCNSECGRISIPDIQDNIDTASLEEQLLINESERSSVVSESEQGDHNLEDTDDGGNQKVNFIQEEENQVIEALSQSEPGNQKVSGPNQDLSTTSSQQVQSNQDYHEMSPEEPLNQQIPIESDEKSRLSAEIERVVICPHEESPFKPPRINNNSVICPHEESPFKPPRISNNSKGTIVQQKAPIPNIKESKHCKEKTVVHEVNLETFPDNLERPPDYEELKKQSSFYASHQKNLRTELNSSPSLLLCDNPDIPSVTLAPVAPPIHSSAKSDKSESSSDSKTEMASFANAKNVKKEQPNDSWNWPVENSFQQQPQQSSYLQEQQPNYIQEQQTNYLEQQPSYQQQLQHSYHEHQQSNFQHQHEQPNYLQQQHQNQQSLGLPADACEQSPQTETENQNFVQPSVNYDSSSESIQPVNNNCNNVSLDSSLQSTEADSLNTTQPAQLPWTYSATQYFNQTPNLSTEFPSSCTSSNELWHLNSLIASKAEISIQSEFDCKSNDNVQNGAVNLESNITENYNVDESTENVASNCVPNCENVRTNKDFVLDADYGNSSLSAFFQNSEQNNSANSECGRISIPDIQDNIDTASLEEQLLINESVRSSVVSEGEQGDHNLEDTDDGGNQKVNCIQEEENQVIEALSQSGTIVQQEAPIPNIKESKNCKEKTVVHEFNVETFPDNLERPPDYEELKKKSFYASRQKYHRTKLSSPRSLLLLCDNPDIPCITLAPAAPPIHSSAKSDKFESSSNSKREMASFTNAKNVNKESNKSSPVGIDSDFSENSSNVNISNSLKDKDEKHYNRNCSSLLNQDVSIGQSEQHLYRISIYSRSSLYLKDSKIDDVRNSDLCRKSTLNIENLQNPSGRQNYNSGPYNDYSLSKMKSTYSRYPPEYGHQKYADRKYHGFEGHQYFSDRERSGPSSRSSIDDRSEDYRYPPRPGDFYGPHDAFWDARRHSGYAWPPSRSSESDMNRSDRQNQYDYYKGQCSYNMPYSRNQDYYQRQPNYRGYEYHPRDPYASYYDAYSNYNYGFSDELYRNDPRYRQYREEEQYRQYYAKYGYEGEYDRSSAHSERSSANELRKDMTSTLRFLKIARRKKPQKKNKAKLQNKKPKFQKKEARAKAKK